MRAASVKYLILGTLMPPYSIGNFNVSSATLHFFPEKINFLRVLSSLSDMSFGMWMKGAVNMMMGRARCLITTSLPR